jgi:hypothetical protein
MMNEEQTNSRNPGVRVLVVDSDFLGRHLVGRFLTVKGFQTALASSGDGAHFDLLVSDE